LLVLDGATGGVADRVIADLPGYLAAGDLLVFNDTRVVAARVVGSKQSGGRVEIFLERARGGREALVQLRASKPIREGLEISTAGGIVRVLRREHELWAVEVPEPGEALEFFEKWGDVPLPPYIHRAADANDRERYQSIFAREKGAVAAPTASLHFDAALVAKLDALGVDRVFVTLHVGAGTFQPLRTDDLDTHKMHAERVSVGEAAWRAIQRTHASGGRVIAVGTTVVRALESAALELHAAAGSKPGAGAAGVVWSGDTRLFIRPGFEFQVVDAMITNFHLPQSTLLMLVSAFAGRENVLGAYAHAVHERYRFFSYGDAMLVMPTTSAMAPTASHPRQVPPL
jgi:S-adenosylmethionine:tRNA ribosyltransferase-isomerase